MQFAEVVTALGTLGTQQVTKNYVHCGLTFHKQSFDFLISVILDSYWSQIN